MTICFDVDGTLFDEWDRPRYEVIDLFRWFHAKEGAILHVWSGSGVDYAQAKLRRLGFGGVEVIVKGSIKPDIAVDDQDVELGRVNIQV